MEQFTEGESTREEIKNTVRTLTVRLFGKT